MSSKLKYDDKCVCGWLLPRACVAIKIGTAPSVETQDAGCYTQLRCPECGRGHIFFEPRFHSEQSVSDTIAACNKVSP